MLCVLRLSSVENQVYPLILKEVFHSLIDEAVYSYSCTDTHGIGKC